MYVPKNKGESSSKETADLKSISIHPNLFAIIKEPIVANRNYVPIAFIVLDIDYIPSCPIILGRPFLRTVGAIIDMKEGNIRLQFPLKRAWALP